jgi:hypothetical protein
LCDTTPGSHNVHHIQGKPSPRLYDFKIWQNPFVCDSSRRAQPLALISDKPYDHEIDSTSSQMSASTVSRQFARAALRTSARNTFATSSRQAFRQGGGRRFYSSEPPKKSSASSLFFVAGAAILGAGGYYFYTQGSPLSATTVVPTKEDYQKVYNEIAARLEEKDDYDDGSYGPVLVRLAWHASGTYDKETGTGGSNGATMRFAPEGDHGANAGLKHARDFLEPIKGTFSQSSTLLLITRASTLGRRASSTLMASS